MQVNPKTLEGVLCVDPGDHTGWAYFDGTLRPITGQINLPRRRNPESLNAQLSFMFSNFATLLLEYSPHAVALEGVEFWSGSAKSRMAASRQNLFKLAYLVGGYAHCCQTAVIECGIVPATKWKGQMDKEAVALRVQRINGEIYPTSHITDAVGLGFSLAGGFNHG